MDHGTPAFCNTCGAAVGKNQRTCSRCQRPVPNRDGASSSNKKWWQAPQFSVLQLVAVLMFVVPPTAKAVSWLYENIRMKALESTIAHLEEQLNSTQKQLDDARVQNAMSAADLKTSDGKVVALSGHVAELEEKLARQPKGPEELARALEASNAAKADAQLQLNQASKDSERYRKQLADAQSNLETAQRQAAAASHDAQAARAELEQVSRERDEWRGRLTRGEQEISDLRDQLAHAKGPLAPVAPVTPVTPVNPGPAHVGSMTRARWDQFVRRYQRGRMGSAEILQVLGAADEKSDNVWVYYDAAGSVYRITFDSSMRQIVAIKP